METYDPMRAPDPKAWLALDERERIELAAAYHRRARIPLPQARRPVHAAAHATVETQIALADETPVAAHAARLMAEGLDRHETIHAIGAVLTGVVYDVTKENVTEQDDVSEIYYARLAALTAAGWRRGEW